MALGAPPHKDVRLLRAVLARELDTINEYEEMADRAEDPHIRDFFLHLALEEKEHVAEAMALIHERDPDQQRESDEADVGAAHFTGAAAEAAAATVPTTTPAPAPRFTVGSLKRARGEAS